MRIRHNIDLFHIIPDRMGYTIRHARVPADWSLTGYVARIIGRVYTDRLRPKSAGQFSELDAERERLTIDLSGVGHE
jgi:hypothetical protein